MCGQQRQQPAAGGATTICRHASQGARLRCVPVCAFSASATLAERWVDTQAPIMACLMLCLQVTQQLVDAAVLAVRPDAR
jgi:hypothetical protein